MRKGTLTIAVAGALALSACGGGGDSNAPTAEENAELNNAAEMLNDNTIDASPDSLTAAESPGGNGEAPAATGDALVGGGDNAATNGSAVNAQ
ncbi:MAG TPA: hypothetical protein VF655_09805 [Allosphingosinicella sp.]|jgi:hypothetical protein